MLVFVFKYGRDDHFSFFCFLFHCHIKYDCMLYYFVFCENEIKDHKNNHKIYLWQSLMCRHVGTTPGEFVSHMLPDEELSSLKIVQVEELPHTQRPSQGRYGTQMGQVLFKGPAAYSNGLCCKVSPQLFSCTGTQVLVLWSFTFHASEVLDFVLFRSQGRPGLSFTCSTRSTLSRSSNRHSHVFV